MGVAGGRPGADAMKRQGLFLSAGEVAGEGVVGTAIASINWSRLSIW
jgi:hypothetical protein